MIPPTEKQLNFVETIEKTLQIKASDMTKKRQVCVHEVYRRT